MAIKDKVKKLRGKLKLDKHHSMERFGVVFGALSLVGLLALGSTGASAFVANQNQLGDTAVWTEAFKTSKTQLDGSVDGVYTNQANTKALVVMHFDETAQISYNANDYKAWLLGSSPKLGNEPVATAGIESDLHVFGSTGYMGVLLEADQPFERQVMNLTMRATNELAYTDTEVTLTEEEEALLEADPTFSKYDQWEVYINPGAKGAEPIQALESEHFDPAHAFYEVALRDAEDEVRAKLDQNLTEMRAYLAQIESYNLEMATTKVDGLFLRSPKVPAIVDGDAVVGQGAAESETGESTLELQTDTSVPGGFILDWRKGNVYDGYLTDLVPEGKSFIEFLNEKSLESSNVSAEEGDGVSDMQWILSDGTDLMMGYQGSESAMRPLTNVMNNLSQAYQNYMNAKQSYQSDTLLELLQLDAQIRDVQGNTSTNTADDFMVTYY